MMRKVLVTGGTGFIGACVVAQLQQRGAEVACLVRRGSRVESLAAQGVELRYGDVCAPDTLAAAVAGVDAVYHLAGLTKALRSGDFERVNAQGVAHLAQACADQPTPPVLVVVSSLAAAGPAVAGRPRVETDPPAPVSHYGRSKRSGELVAQSFADRVPITVVRPPIVFGAGDVASLEMYRPIHRLGVHVAPGLNAIRVSLIHADDLTAAMLLLAERGTRLSGEADSNVGIYFVADEEAPTYAELGRWIAQALGREKLFVLPIPKPVVWASGAAHELLAQCLRRPYVLNLDKVREATAGSWICSAARLESELGFRPAESVATRVQETADWYRAAGWL